MWPAGILVIYVSIIKKLRNNIRRYVHNLVLLFHVPPADQPKIMIVNICYKNFDSHGLEVTVKWQRTSGSIEP